MTKEAFIQRWMQWHDGRDFVADLDALITAVRASSPLPETVELRDLRGELATAVGLRVLAKDRDEAVDRADVIDKLVTRIINAAIALGRSSPRQAQQEDPIP